MARQYDEAIAQFQKALDLNPNIPVVRGELGFAYGMKRMYPQAISEFDKIADQDKVISGNQFFPACSAAFMPFRAGAVKP